MIVFFIHILLLSQINAQQFFDVIGREPRPSRPTFSIDFENNQFLKDGEPFRYISGEMHYYRIPRDYWRDRLVKLRAAGLNTVSMYVPWNLHEPLPNQYHFSMDANFTMFLDIASEMGIHVLLRPGPYTCGEWDFGGLPWWLLKTDGLKNTRSSDPEYLKAVRNWFGVLLPMVHPYLHKNGGPIIMVQVENEYGSYRAPGCDHTYGIYLRDLFQYHLGSDVLLFTTDGGGLGYLPCGYIPGVYPTVDFGPSDSNKIVSAAFQAQRTYAPRGPLVNSEFYPGWLDVWGTPHARTPIAPILDTMTTMYAMNASFNFYMFMGGTNFGYMQCTMPDGKAVTTTYDYDAPLSETGDVTDKFYAIRTKVEELTGWRIPYPVPPPQPKRAYGRVRMQYVGSVVELLNSLSSSSRMRRSTFPLSMEELDAPYGFVLYETALVTSGPATLYIPGIRDRGYVMVDGRSQGVLVGEYGTYKRHTMTVRGIAGQKLQILVENMGRKCAGYPDRKGLITNATLDGIHVLTGWTHYPIEISSLFYNSQIIRQSRRKRQIDPTPRTASGFSPSLYVGTFPATVREDTFFDPSGWSKGQFFINGFNVGRYWPSVGPQVTLYTPKTMIRQVNYAVMLELEKPGNCADSNGLNCAVSFTDKHNINKDVHTQNEDGMWFSLK